MAHPTDTHPMQHIVSQMSFASQSVMDAMLDENMNERTALELSLMTLGSLAEEAGLGDDVARWVKNGVDNAKRRASRA